MIEFAESVVGTFRITQPGSSVATSLVSGEAQKKQIGILDIRGKNFRLHPVPLTQVRSFATTELSLREHRAELDPEDPKIDSKVSSVLEDEVRYMANTARNKMESILKEALQAGNDAGEKDSSLTYRLQKPNEVLVRIRVEHNGFTTLNNQRFGAKFVGEVANPSDMLLFHRKKDPKLASKIKKKKIEPMAPEQIEQTNMEDLIKQQLDSCDTKLHVLVQDSLSEALEEYVEKSLTSAAISDVAVGTLSQKTKTLIAMNKANNDDDDDGPKLEKESQVLDALNRESQSQEDVSMVEAEDDEEEQPSKKSKAKGSKKRKGASTQEKENSMELDDSLEVPKSRSKKGATKKKKKSPLDSDEDDDDSFQAPKAPGKKVVAKKATLDSDDDDDSFGPTKSRGKKAPAPKNDDDDDLDSFGAPPAKRAPAAKKAKTAPRRNNMDFSDSEELSDVDDMEVVKAAPKARSKPAARAKRSSAKKPVKYAFDSDDEDEEEEDAIIGSDGDDEDMVDVEPPSKRKKAASGRALSGTARSKKKNETTNRKAQFPDSDDDVVFMGSSQTNDNLDSNWGSHPTASQY